MIKRRDVRWISLSSDEVELAVKFANLVLKAKNGGGKSCVYKDPEERRRHALDNQITGQVAHLAASLYITGSVDQYVDQMIQAGREGTDHGIDIPPNIDVKSGRMNKKRPNTDPFSQDLLVNPSEFREDWIYLSAQVHEVHEDGAKVCLVGWCESRDIEGKLSKKRGVPPGCYGLPAYRLRPIDLLRWRHAA